MNDKTPTLKLYLIALSTLLCACAGTSDSGSGSDGDGGFMQVRIAGNSAIGRPGSWSSNCLAENCVRADNDGNYLLATSADSSGLMWSLIDDQVGGEIQLFSRYRHNAEQTSALVNINPSTHAILDAWSQYSQSMAIDQCFADIACSSVLLDNFTTDLELTIISQLDTLLGESWPEGRDPFSDVYIADETDPLDIMHDYFHFVVTPSEFQVLNNNDDLVTSIGLSQLMQLGSLADAAITAEQFYEARQWPVTYDEQTYVTVNALISPNQPMEAPITVWVDASRSSSVNLGPLQYIHDLTLADGTNIRQTGETASAGVTIGGEHIWVVTVIDDLGYSASQGFLIETYGAEGQPPTFGASGSCITPDSLTANTLNICQEVQDGTELGACDEISSVSVNLVASPAPCPREVQNDGTLLGVCTVLSNEMRTFFYDNPRRFNNVETFEEKQQRTAEQCSTLFSGDWSTSAD